MNEALATIPKLSMNLLLVIPNNDFLTSISIPILTADGAFPGTKLLVPPEPTPGAK